MFPPQRRTRRSRRCTSSIARSSSIDLPWLDNVERAKRPIKLPVVLTVDEIARILERLSGTHHLIGRLMYGTGLRILGAAVAREGRRFLDSARSWFAMARDSKDRVTLLPRG